MENSIEITRLLQQVTELSHEFGTLDYVCGGGGNTSCKNSTTLWIKPSGTTLADLTPQSFIPMDRGKLAELYNIHPPADSSARETLIKEKMEKAIPPGISGRASVEAPLHDSLSSRFVVHTHPALINGMTCAKEGRRVAEQLFPQSLWLDYIDPGYTLCMQVRQEVLDYKEQNGQEPEIIFLKNHGVFVSADSPQRMRELYADILNKLKAEYHQAGISPILEIAPIVSDKQVAEATKRLLEAMSSKELNVNVSGEFDIADGPISPDHIVYSKSHPFIGTPTQQDITAFKQKKGYLPQVAAFDGMVLGVGQTPKKATLALKMAQDGALVKKLAHAFGGIDYMTDRAREFIENWEVESYRSQQI